MSTSQSATGSSPKITGGEIVIVAFLLLVGGAGGFLARSHLAALSAELETVTRTAAVAASRPASARAADISNQGSDASQSAPASMATPAPAPQPAASAAQSPAQLRLETLQLLSSLLDEQVFNLLPSAAVISRSSFGPFANQPLPAYVIDNEGSLSSTFGEFFGLSENETAMLQSAATSVRDQIDGAIRANATIRQTGPDAYEITVPGVANADNLRGQFISTFRSIMGEERYQVFAKLNGEVSQADITRRIPEGITVTPEMLASMQASAARQGPSGFFNAYGQDDVTVTFTKTDNRLSYSIDRGGRGGGGGSGGLGGPAGTSNPMLTRLETEIGPAIELLPEDFWQ